MSIEIELYHSELKALVDKEDLELVRPIRWRLKINHGYPIAVSFRSGTKEGAPMHRLITNAPKGMVVDHINGNTLDNRRCNIRVCTSAQNSMNKKSYAGSKSKFKGVYWSTARGKWKAGLEHVGKNYHMGYFSNEVDAAKAYDTKAKEVFGEFARLNFPN